MSWDGEQAVAGNIRYDWWNEQQWQVLTPVNFCCIVGVNVLHV